MKKVGKWVRLRSNEFHRQWITLGLGLATGVKAITSFESLSVLWKALLLFLLTGLTIGGLVLAWKDEKRRTPLRHKRPEELVADNEEWLAEQGHIAILTRDLSWVMSDRLEALLVEKAQQGSLSIIASRRSDHLLKLQQAGALVLFRKRVPRVRFAALRYGTSDCRILITRQVRGKVEVREYEQQDFPTYQMCLDLLDELLGERSKSAP